MSVLWSPRKPRLHTPTRVREPQRRPIQHKFLVGVADALLERFKRRDPPALLAAEINHDDRATRCDWLESIWLVVYCLLAVTQLKSLRCGFRCKKIPGGWKHDFVGLTIATIVKQTGLEASTVSAVLTVLRKCGYLCGPSKDNINHIKQPWDRRDGVLVPLPAIRRFTFLFFAELGLGTTLSKIRSSKPRPTAPASASGPILVAALAHAHALKPPDSS